MFTIMRFRCIRFKVLFHVIILLLLAQGILFVTLRTSRFPCSVLNNGYHTITR